MKRIHSIVLLSLILVTIMVLSINAASPTSDTDTKKPRTYDKKVDLYEVDLNFRLPQEKKKELEDLDNTFQSDQRPQLVDPNPPRRVYPINPQPNEQKLRTKKKKENWILPPQSKELKESASDKERKESGWGWLADELAESREQEETEREQEDEEAYSEAQENEMQKQYEEGKETFRPESTFKPMIAGSFFSGLEVDKPSATSSANTKEDPATEEAVKKALDAARTDGWNTAASARNEPAGDRQNTQSWNPSTSENTSGGNRESLSRTKKILSSVALPGRARDPSTKTSANAALTQTPTFSSSTLNAPSSLSSFDHGSQFSKGFETSLQTPQPNQPTTWKPSSENPTTRFKQGGVSPSVSRASFSTPRSSSALQTRSLAQPESSFETYKRFERPKDSSLSTLPW